MKKFLKAVARGGWRLTGPVRRPVSRKVSAHLARSIAEVLRDEVHPRLDGVAHGLGLAREGVEASRQEIRAERRETDLLLDGLMREVSRLQDQIEHLQGMVLESLDARAAPGLVGRVEDEASAA